MLKEICKYIENELKPTYKLGTNLFAGYVPPTIEANHIIVIESGGRPIPDLPDYLEKAIQVLAIAIEYFSAIDMSNDIYDLLHASAGITLPIVVAGKEYYVNTAVAVSSPQSLGQDDKGKFVLSTNYILRIKDANK